MASKNGLTTTGVVFIVLGAVFMAQNTGLGAAFIAIGCALSATSVAKSRSGGDSNAD